jgi:endonuclease YncB( thermonuclease family)
LLEGILTSALHWLLYLRCSRQFSAVPTAEPRTISVGTVTRVVDGDTIDVKLSSGHIRLYGIDWLW